MWQDSINSAYELLGGLFILLSVFKVMKDRSVRGVSRLHVLFFVTWGVWNLYYYPFLHQWWSFIGGLFILATNATWLGLLTYYMHKPVRRSIQVSMYDSKDPLDINDIRPQDLDLFKIANTLSHIGRYGGRSNRYYSVAEHSYYASIWARRYGVDPALALLHDAAEAFVGDAIATYKKHIRIWELPLQELEDKILETIYAVYGVTRPTLGDMSKLKQLDLSLRKLEARQLGLKLMPGGEVDPLSGLALPHIGMNPDKARQVFWLRAKDLGIRKDSSIC